MDNIIEEYQRLSGQSATAVVPGTTVPGNGVTADAIAAKAARGIEVTGVLSDCIISAVNGVDTTGAAADTVDPKTLQIADSAGNSVKADTVDPKPMSVGENTDGIGNNNAGNGDNDGNKDDDPPPAPAEDDFAKQPRRLQNYLLAKEAAGNVTIIKPLSGLYYYDKIDKVCPLIVNKPSEKGGNITKLLRDNVAKGHAPFITNAMGKEVFGWWLDTDEFTTVVENFDLPHLVAFNNGVIDLAEDRFINWDAHAPEYYFSTRIAADYTEKPMVPLSLDFFENVCKEGWELVLGANGILLSNVRDMKKAFFWLGPRNSGKTTMSNFDKALIVPKFEHIIRAVSLTRLGGRFSPSALVDAHYSWAGDIGAKEFTRPAFDNFKTLTGMDPFEAERKGIDLRISEPKCALAFNCNSFPRFPLVWDYDGDDIDNGAGRARIVLFHTRKTFTEEMIVDYRRKHGMTVDKVLAADKDAIASEMIRQAGRIYRGELLFPKAAFEEVYCEGKTLKERFFYFVKTRIELTGNPADVVPLRKLIDAYKDAHPDEFIPYRDKDSEERGFGALLNYVIKLDSNFVQTKKKVAGYPNPVSCLVGCKLK